MKKLDTELFSESYRIKLNLDCDYPFSIYLASNRILFGVKSIEKGQLQFKFSLIHQYSAKKKALCVASWIEFENMSYIDELTCLLLLSASGSYKGAHFNVRPIVISHSKRLRNFEYIQTRLKNLYCP